MADVQAPTLTDVAAQAGVSVATASRVLSGSRRVSADKEAKVHRAAKDVGYRYNPFAGALRGQRTGTVGVLLPRFSPGFLSSLVESISAVLDSTDRALVLRYVEPNAHSAAEQVNALIDRGVDGVILCAPSVEVGRAAAEAAGSVPLVFVGRNNDAILADSVGLDEDRAAQVLIDHLTPGAKRVAIVGFDLDNRSDQRRSAAVALAAQQAGLSVEPVLSDAADLSGGIAAAERMLGAAELPQAPDGAVIDTIVCANDEVAQGVAAVLRMRGVGVPDAVQLASLMDVAFTDQEPRAITTLRHPWPAMGREAVRLLTEALESSSPASVTRRTVLGPHLLVGESTR